MLDNSNYEANYSCVEIHYCEPYHMEILDKMVLFPSEGSLVPSQTAHW